MAVRSRVLFAACLVLVMVVAEARTVLDKPENKPNKPGKPDKGDDDKLPELQCGHFNETCCLSPRRPCDDHLLCGASGRCERCGDAGEQCCNSTSWRGEERRECSGDAVCNTTTSICFRQSECGHFNETCCLSPRRPCDDNMMCGATSGRCERCGDIGEQCCNATAWHGKELRFCSGNAVCNATSSVCVPQVECGHVGEACCASPRRRCTGNLMCGSSGQCESCGRVGQQCCSPQTWNGKTLRGCRGNARCDTSSNTCLRKN